MKLHALMIAVALAAGSAFAIAANDTPATAPGTTAGASSSTTMDSGSAKTTKKVSAHKRHRKVHASRRHHERVAERRHERHENLTMNGRHTRSMGAAAATPSVDLDSTAREHRMDSAYNDWLRTSRR